MLHNLTSFIFLFSVIILLPELSGNPNSIQKYFYVSSSLILYYIVSSGIILRLFNIQPVTFWLTKLLKFIFPISLIISVTLSVATYFTTPNYIYSLLPLNSDKFFYIALLSFTYLLLQKDNSFFKKNYEKIISYSPIILLFILFIISLWPFDRFAQLVKEDQVIEYAQFLVLLTASIFAFLTSKYFIKKNIFIFFIFIFLAIGLFATTGDEISWGQRIFNISTPEKLKELNVQEETGFHNITFIDGLVPIIYIIISFYGMISYFLKKYIRSDHLKFFTPGPHLFFFFLFPFIYNLYTSLIDHNIGNWSEVAELFLYLGVSIFITECYFKFIKPPTNA